MINVRLLAALLAVLIGVAAMWVLMFAFGWLLANGYWSACGAMLFVLIVAAFSWPRAQ